jgi:hypothetical protein
MKSAAAALVDVSRTPSPGAQKPGLLGETLTDRKSYRFPVLPSLIRACLLALAFTGLLQSRPAPPQQAVPPAHQTPATAGQQSTPGVEGDLATIIQSRSTNSLGYSVVIHNDGSATTVTVSGRPATVARRDFPPGTVDTKTLRRLLTAIGDVSRIPIGHCMKSVSFGNTTQIAYAGKTSGDLQCIRPQASGGDLALQQASEDLARFVRTTLSQLKINDRRISPNE